MTRCFLTADLPPIEAAFRETPEDFEVEEAPLYPAAGEGDHVYVRIEKRGVSTAEAVRGIARRLGRRPGEIGVAGLKDARAVARQTISIEHLRDEDRPKIDEAPRVRALSFERHRNKLKRGHLRGNRFTIRLGCDAGAALPIARAALERLRGEGVPNRFGLQRFGGEGGATSRLGRALLRGEEGAFLALLLGDPARARSDRVREARERYERGDLAGARDAFPASFAAERAALRALLDGKAAAAALAAIDPADRGFFVSAAQSAVFNAILDERLAAGTLGRLETGDVAMLHRNGACFLVEDAAKEQPRAAAFEVSPTGPLPGTRLLAATGAPGERERAALEREGLTMAMFESRLALAPRGERRALRIPLEDPAAEAIAADRLELRFFLPAGSYATAVVEELVKREVE